MIMLTKSDVGWVDVVKALGSVGGEGGPTGKPRGGKYIRRWWESDHWEYEYQDDPHPTAHGIQNTYQSVGTGHSLEVPSGAREGLEDRATSGSQDAMKQLYEHSRTHENHQQPGKKYKAKHPVTGKPIEISVSAGPEDKPGTLKFTIKIPGEKWSKTVTSWERVNAWFREVSHITEHPSLDGKTVNFISKMRSFEFDDSINDYIQKPRRKGGQITPWVLSIPKGSPAWGKNPKTNPEQPWHFADNRINAMSQADAVSKAAYLNRMYARIAETSKFPNVSDQLASGSTASGILEQGTNQVTWQKNAHAKFRQVNKFDSIEERNAFIQQLAIENEMAIMDAANVSVPLENIASNPDSAVYRGLAYTADKFNPKAIKYDPKDPNATQQPLQRYIQQRIRNIDRYDNAKTSGGEEGEALMSRVQAGRKSGYSEEDAIQEAGDSMPVQDGPVDATQLNAQQEATSGHTQAAGNQEAIEATWYRNAATHKLDKYLQENPAFAPYAEKLKTALSTMGSSLAPMHEQSAPYFEAVASLPNAQQVASELIVGPEEWSKLKTQFLKEGRGAEAESAIKSMAIMRADFYLSIDPAEILRKATPQYSHKEGTNEYPRYYYTDAKGNNMRFTNAPEGHNDASKMFGEVAPHPNEPLFETDPQYFTMDGRKLSRAPYEGAPVEWNQSYHPQDPKNLWAGRWVNPVSGEHEYTYIDSDLNASGLRAHKINSLVDVRLPMLRQYMVGLLRSPHTKDKTLAVIIALLDQGHFRIRELVGASVGDLKISREIVMIGRRKVHADPALRQTLWAITANRDPREPLFAVPVVDVNGDIDYTKMRRIGPHLMVNLLEELGTPVEALQMYHASQTYSSEMQRIFEQQEVSYEAAHHFALLEVSSEMGHNLDHVNDYEPAINAIKDAVIDPVVVAAIKQNVMKLGIGSGPSNMRRPIFDSCPRVSMALMDRTEEEKEFSRWLHTAPVHLFAQEATQYAQIT